jgi:hypothetical protein
MHHIGDSIFHESILSLNTLKEKAKFFKDKGIQEDSKLVSKCDEELNLVKESLVALPNNEALSSIKTSVPRLGVAALRAEVEKQLEHSGEANNLLEERIKHRKSTVDSLIKELDTYLPTRAQFTLKRIKDLISAEDAAARIDFIGQLKPLLEAYRDRGDSATLLEKINENVDNFSGFHLKALLNKMKAEVYDLDKEIPKNYNQVPDKKLNSLELERGANKVLEALQTNHPEYVKSIRALRQQINTFSDDWEGAPELARMLQDSVNNFVIQHGNKLPTKAAHQEFEEKFSLKLHSRDEQMGAHKADWKYYVTNTLLAVATLGIALIVQMASTKYKQGYSSLFLEKTKKEEQIEAMEQQIRDLP